MQLNTKKLELSMARCGFSNARLIKAAGISSRTFYNLIQKPAVVRPVTVGKLAKALNVDVEYLIELEA